MAGGNGIISPTIEDKGKAISEEPKLPFHLVGDDTKKMTELMEFLERCTFFKIDLNDFTENALLLLGYTARSYLKGVKVLTNYTKKEVAEKLVTEAVAANVVPLKDKLNITEFMNLAKWLKSPASVSAIHRVHTYVMLEKRYGNLTLKEAALVHIFRLQLADYKTAMKQKRRPFDEKIADLRRKIRILEEEREASLDEVRRAFVPASNYVPLTKNEVRLRAYEMYLAEGNKTNNEI